MPCSRERKDAVDSGISGLPRLSRYSSRISPFRCFLKQLVDNLSSDDVGKICSELKLPGKLTQSYAFKLKMSSYVFIGKQLDIPFVCSLEKTERLESQ